MIYGGFDIHALKISDGSPAWDFASELGSPGAYTSPALNGSSVFFNSAWFVKLDASSGTKLWEIEDHSGGITQQQNPPYVINGHVYFANWMGEAFCVNETNGEVIWKVAMPFSFSNAPIANNESVFFGLLVPYDTEYSLYCYALDGVTLKWNKKIGLIPNNMLLSGEKLYVVAFDSMYCIDTGDGSVIWKYQLENASTSAPLLVGNKLLIGGGWDLVCLNATTGALIWCYENPGPNPDAFSGVSYDGTNIYSSCADGKVYCFKL